MNSPTLLSKNIGAVVIMQNWSDSTIFTDGYRKMATPQLSSIWRILQTIENLESHLEYYNRHLHRYLKDFYGFDIAATTNLLIPATDKIDLHENELEDSFT